MGDYNFSQTFELYYTRKYFEVKVIHTIYYLFCSFEITKEAK